MTADLNVGQLRAEVEKMVRIPFIVFADGTFGRVPRIAGTGIEVWEVIKTYDAVEQSWDRLAAAFHWLSEEQLQGALAYANAYPEEVRARLDQQREAEALLSKERTSG